MVCLFINVEDCQSDRSILWFEWTNLILYLIPTLTRHGSPGCWQEQDLLPVSVSWSTEQWARLFQRAWMPHRWTLAVNGSSSTAHLAAMFPGEPVNRQLKLVSEHSYRSGCDWCYLPLQMLLFVYKHFAFFPSTYQPDNKNNKQASGRKDFWKSWKRITKKKKKTQLERSTMTWRYIFSLNTVIVSIAQFDISAFELLLNSYWVIKKGSKLNCGYSFNVNTDIFTLSSVCVCVWWGWGWGGGVCVCASHINQRWTHSEVIDDFLHESAVEKGLEPEITSRTLPN